MCEKIDVVPRADIGIALGMSEVCGRKLKELLTYIVEVVAKVLDVAKNACRGIVDLAEGRQAL